MMEELIEAISGLSIPELVELMRRIIDEIQLRAMEQAN